MDNHNQLIKLCCICDNKRVYNEDHRIYNPCKTCVAKIWARYYQANRDKKIARSKLYQDSTNYIRKSQTQQIELNNKMEELTRAMETLLSKIE